jgi:hypothetical protein
MRNLTEVDKDRPMTSSNRPPVDPNVTVIHEEVWLVKRTGRLDEVVNPDTGTVRYRIKVWDEGRDAFVTQTFNDQVPAEDFLERLRMDGERYHNFRFNKEEE